MPGITGYTSNTRGISVTTILGKQAVGVGIGLASLAATAAVVAALYADKNLNGFGRRLAKVREAGYVDRADDINDGRMACLEGPDNGPALLLVHGQTTDRCNYAPARERLKKGTNCV